MSDTVSEDEQSSAPPQLSEEERRQSLRQRVQGLGVALPQSSSAGVPEMGDGGDPPTQADQN